VGSSYSFSGLIFSGPTLTGVLVSCGTEILESLATLVQGILDKGNLPVLTSVVWNGLDRLKDLPQDNKVVS
jgi:hypothetical protein